MPSGFAKTHRPPIHLVRSTDINGRPCYFVLMCADAKIRSLREAIASRTNGETLDISQYGTIIASGFGHDVIAEDQRMLKEKYNYIVDSKL